MPIWVIIVICVVVFAATALVVAAIRDSLGKDFIDYDHLVVVDQASEADVSKEIPDQGTTKGATVATHRTALVIDASNPSSSFKERVNRLLQSLNGPNIKVDVYTYGPKTSSAVTAGPPSWESSSVESSDFPSAVQEVASKGYVQVLTSQPA